MSRPNSGRRFSAAILLICALGSLLVLFHGLFVAQRPYLHGPGALRNAMIFLALPATAACLFLTMLRWGGAWRSAIAASLVAVTLGVYGAEAFLAWRIARLPAESSEDLGLAYDKRSMREVLADLKRDGVDAVPALWPSLLLKSAPDGTTRSALRDGQNELLPVAGLAHAETVMCREVGSYVRYRADRHGFNNPDALWDQPVDLVLIGDSFAQGQCVNPMAQMATLLRASVPRTLSLAMGHDGPLLELATLKEFGSRLKPRVVLWLYFQGNDLHDLARENASPLLRRYLDAGFSQGLVARQAEVDRALAAYLSGRTIEQDQDETRRRADLGAVLRLRNLRRAAGMTAQGPAPDLARLEDVLREASRTVRSWGGSLYFVYLPDWREATAGSGEELRDEVLAMAARTTQGVLNMQAMMAAAPSPTAFFFYPGSHYGPAGQAAVAKAIKTLPNVVSLK
jgi:hypothetical protein